MAIDKELVQTQEGVASRQQLRQWGANRWHVRDQVRAKRWRIHGRHTIALHTGELSERARWWRAHWEAGAGSALDGTSGLGAAGVTGYTADRVVLSVPGGRRRPDVPGARVHYVERRLAGEIVPVGIPRVRPEIAALRGASWAGSDKQAALILVLPVQQRIVAPERLQAAAAVVPLHWRPAFIRTVVGLISLGAQALGELDFSGLCRKYGLPEPDHQIVRQGRNGRCYLDAGWEALGLFVEIDGIHHLFGLAPVEDAVRQNEVSLSGDTVLRLPLLGMHTHEAVLMGQVLTAYRARAATRRSTAPVTSTCDET